MNPKPPDKDHSEILILPDGRILAHNLTPVMARVLAGLNPRDAAMRRRGRARKTFPA